METYYTRKEYNEMKAILNRKIKAAEKKIAALEKKIHDLEYPLDIGVELEESTSEEETHVTEE